SYFTAGEKEVRAWTIRRGTKAPQAAGEIHSDFERGFIRAETLGWEDFVTAGSVKLARERGLVRSEGKEYVVQDGDIMLFRFNVWAGGVLARRRVSPYSASQNQRGEAGPPAALVSSHTHKIMPVDRFLPTRAAGLLKALVLIALLPAVPGARAEA